MHRDDLVLLQRWQFQGDAEAFDLLVTRHAGMVYAACKRILRNTSDAEDVTQECFLKLAQSSDRVNSSVGGWLHRIATRQSLNRLRQDNRRVLRERTFAVQNTGVEATAWNDIYAYIDEALEQLPEPTRDLVIAHFLNRQTHDAIATERGIPRRTVSYRIEGGVARIRKYLKSQGVRVGAMALTGALTTRSAEAAPPALTAALGRVAISGVASPTAPNNTIGGLLLMNAKLIGAGTSVAAIVSIGIYAFWPQDVKQEPPPTDSANRVIAEPDSTVAEIEAGTPTTLVNNAIAFTDSPEAEMAPTATQNPGWIVNPNDAISISGYVLDENGAAIGNAQVETTAIGLSNIQDLVGNFNDLLIARTSDKHRHLVSSDDDGSFRVDDIRYAGLIMLSASRAGYTVGDQGPLEILRLDPGMDKQGVLITMNQGGWTLEGQVVEDTSGRPIADAHVITLNSWQPSAHTDRNGLFSMSFASAKLMPLQVVSDTLGRATFSDVFTGATERVTLRMPATASVAGLITEHDSPTTNVKVVLEGNWAIPEHTTANVTRGRAEGQGFGYQAAVNQQGGYRITGVDPGQEYTIVLLDSENMPISPRETLELLPGSETIWNHDLRNVVTIHGKVLGSETGKPLRDVYVNAQRDSLPMADVETQVDSDGSYRLRLPSGEGRYRIYPKYLHSDDATMAATYGKEVHLESGDSTQLNLSLLDPWTITARIVDSEGRPIQTDAIVVNVPNRGTQVLRASDRDGLVRWAGVAPGTETWMAVTAMGYTGTLASVAEYKGMPGSVYHAGDLVLYETSAGIEGVVSNAAGELLADTTLKITAHFGPDESMLFLSARTNGQGQFAVMNGVPVTATYFSIQTTNTEGKLIGETEYFSIADDTLTHIGQIALR